MVLGALTWQQSRQYSDIETLWSTTIARNPTGWMAYNNLGEMKLSEGRTDEAIAHFQTALRFQPDEADLHNNLGNAFRAQCRLDESVSHLQRALMLLSARDNAPTAKAQTQYNLGNALFEKGQLDAAITQYREALAALPGNADMHNNLANALAARRLPVEAIAHYQRAAEINPRSALFQNNLAWILAACAEPSLRDGAKAVQLAERANQLSGAANPIILRTLAAAYAESGQFLRAVEAAQRALERAAAQANHDLAATLRREIALYQTGAAHPAKY